MSEVLSTNQVDQNSVCVVDIITTTSTTTATTTSATSATTTTSSSTSSTLETTHNTTSDCTLPQASSNSQKKVMSRKNSAAVSSSSGSGSGSGSSLKSGQDTNKYVKRQFQSRLLNYRYNGCDDSISYKYLLAPFADYLVQFVPRSIAPNTLTLSALLFTVVGAAACFVSRPTMDVPIPRWLALYSGFALIAYQTLDNMDGRHARRTNSSSALGMLFDHGCDAVNTALIAVIISTGCCVGIQLLLILWISMMSIFAMATWEEYITGRLYMGVFNGPSDGILVSVGIFLSLAVEPSCMQWPLNTWPSIAPYLSMLPVPVSNIIGNMGVGYLLLTVTCISAIVNSFAHMQRVYVYVSEHAQHKRVIMWKALYPFAVFIIMIAVWPILSPADMFSTHPHLFVYSMSLLFCDMICKLMLEHMCDIDCQIWRKLLIPSVLCFGASLILPQFGIAVPESTLMWGLCVVHAVSFSHFVFYTCTEMAELLNVYCFSIGKRSD
jgi:ethanolaminephosphotransferase